MTRIAPKAILIVAALLLSATPVLAAETGQRPQPSPNNPSSGQLVTQSPQWDGKVITYQGEVITEAQERGEYSWIHVNDDAYYIKNVEEGAPLGGYNSGHAVWIPTELTRKIDNYGDYTHEGDVVRVRGVFNAACGQHGGDMDIHATALDVTIPGHRFKEPIHPVKGAVALAIALLAAGAWLLNRRAGVQETFARR